MKISQENTQEKINIQSVVNIEDIPLLIRNGIISKDELFTIVFECLRKLEKESLN